MPYSCINKLMQNNDKQLIQLSIHWQATLIAPAFMPACLLLNHKRHFLIMLNAFRFSLRAAGWPQACFSLLKHPFVLTEYLVGENTLTSQTSTWEAARGCWAFRQEETVTLGGRAACEVAWRFRRLPYVMDYEEIAVYRHSSKERLIEGFLLMNAVYQTWE